MTTAFEITNEDRDTLEVWIEPWCHPYHVPRGSVLRLLYVPSRDHPLQTELTAEQLVAWTNSDFEPEAELDGQRVRPNF